MITEQQADAVIGSTAYDADGDKIGKISEVYLDSQTGSLEWLAVNTGMFGTKQSFIPAAQCRLRGEDGDVEVPFDKATVKDAPKMDTNDEHLSPQQEDELHRYYGGAREGVERGMATTEPAGRADEQVDETGRAGTDDAMTRSEERMEVDTQRVATGRARLRKYVVTENVTTTVPVSHEEVRIEREPITEANRDEAMSGPEISEAEHEVTLHAERPVVETHVEPVERVRLVTDTVTEEETVSGQIRKEQIETDAPQDR